MADSDNNVGEKLGEIRGQLREIIHHQNNYMMKQDAIADKLAKLDGVPDQLTRIDARLTELEADRNRRDGAMNFGNWLVKSPLVAWVLAVGVMVYAYLKAPHL